MDPQIERAGEIAYFTDRLGMRHRIHDVCFGWPLAKPGNRRVVPLESRQANHRYFVGADASVRAYRFTKQESRALEPERVLAQLNAAGYIAVTPKAIGALKPT